MSTPALPIFDTSGFPPAPTSDLAQALADALKRTGAAEDHLAREVRSAQALQDRVAELEALCAHLGVAATFRDKAAVFLDLAEVRETTLLNGPEIRAALTHFAPKVDDHARDRSGCRLCAAAMVLHRASPSDEAEVLLLQEVREHRWTLPSGRVRPADTSLVVTAERKLAELTGRTLVAGRTIRLIDGLAQTADPFVCAVVLGSLKGNHVVFELDFELHSGARWFKVADLPAETWDREMLIEIMGREEDAHWSNDAAANPSITQKLWADPAERLTDHGARRRDFRALDNAEQVRSAQAIVDHGQDNLDALLGGVK